ncbi:MAG: site-specific DNA-methyltransferase, partial [Acidimicrobiales bacterium]
MTTAAAPEPRNGRARRPTATARFGSSRRESHDAKGFYERFVAPELSKDTTVVRPKKVDVIYRSDARNMRNVESDSVALVVTSPPYFAGKEYE